MIVGMVVHRRYASRYREIVRILLSHGLGGLVAPFDRFRRRSTIAPPADDLEQVSPTAMLRAHHLRLALEELGPVFIKLGQILSTRVDLLPPVYTRELERLQDRIAPDPFERVRAHLEAELRAPLESLFASFDQEPLAVASLGQVHGAVLMDGRRVVVKVQREGVGPTVAQDVAILRELARISERRSGFLRQMGVVSLIDEFTWSIRAELDYLHEARNAERLRVALAAEEHVRIPAVHWPLTTSAVLTMERVDGIRIDNVEQIVAAGFDPVAIARYTMQSLAQQILEIGLFHADPHPGNFVVCADGVIGIYDFGLVGSLDERIRERMLFLALAVTERDPVRVVDEIATLGAIPGEWDRRALERDIGHLMTQYVGVTLREMPLVAILDDAMTMVRRYQLRLPAELALLVKTATMAEALSRRLDPGINAVEVGEPMIRAAIRRYYSPSFWRERLRGRPLELAVLSADLPGHIQRFISRLDRNDFTIHMQVSDLPTTLHEMNSMVNRLVLAIIAAAGAIGTAMLVLAVKPRWGSWEGYALLVIFVVVTLLVLNVLFRVWRAGRR